MNQQGQNHHIHLRGPKQSETAAGKELGGFGTAEQRGIIRVVCIQHEVILVQIAGVQMVQEVLQTQKQRRGQSVLTDVLICAHR